MANRTTGQPDTRKLTEESREAIRKTVVLFKNDPPEVLTKYIIDLLENQWPEFWVDPETPGS